MSGCLQWKRASAVRTPSRANCSHALMPFAHSAHVQCVRWCPGARNNCVAARCLWWLGCGVRSCVAHRYVLFRKDLEPDTKFRLPNGEYATNFELRWRANRSALLRAWRSSVLSVLSGRAWRVGGGG